MEGRAEGRMEGRAEGRMEGRAEGRMEGRAALLRAFLAARGMAVPPDFPSARQVTALTATSEADSLAAAARADDYADFLARLGIP